MSPNFVVVFSNLSTARTLSRCVPCCVVRVFRIRIVDCRFRMETNQNSRICFLNAGISSLSSVLCLSQLIADGQKIKSTTFISSIRNPKSKIPNRMNPKSQIQNLHQSASLYKHVFRCYFRLNLIMRRSKHHKH